MNEPDRGSPVPRLRLVARDGKRVIDRVPAVDAPETKLFVSFRGITEDEQRAALDAFPGGKRFILVREAS
jgi:hypothetical protein